MRILHSLFTNGVGGTERHVADLASAQCREGHRVALMIREDRRRGMDDPLPGWLHPDIQLLTVPKRIPFLPIYRLVREFNPDIIHTHHGRDSRYLGLLRPDSIPVVATLHMPYRSRDFRRHSGLICVAPWQLANLPPRVRERSTVIPNWLTPLAPLTEEVEPLRQRLKLRDQVRLLGAVGRLEPEKGMDVLIEAFAQAKLENTHLCIFGEGPMERSLRDRIEMHGLRNITLLGYEPLVRYYYPEFDLFISPSRHETFGIALLEAMEARCPIVATRTAGSCDVLSGAEGVRWAYPFEVDSLRDALIKSKGLIGRKIDYPSLAEFTLEGALHAVMAFYKRILSA
jgi:glycosyltransferase involved in cell wall biosynthesis